MSDVKKASIFDERPGLDVNDDPSHPERVAPDVIAPDLGPDTPFRGTFGTEIDTPSILPPDDVPPVL